MKGTSYALFADGNTSFSFDNKRKSTLKTLFKSTLLFENRILLSDSQVIGNKNFRELLSEDADFLNLFDQESLIIGIRDEADFPVINRKHSKDLIPNPDLSQVLDTFIAFNKCNWVSDKMDAKKRYANKNDLDTIFDLASHERYKIKEVGIRFSDDVINIFTTDQVRKDLGDKLSEAIHKFALEKRATQESDGYNKKGGFGIAFFQNELENLLKKDGFDSWLQFEKSILDFALAPYLTSFPKLLKANPRYLEDHQRRLSIVRGNPIVTKEVYSTTDYKTYLSRYKEGLELLTSLDIRDLRSSKEFANYRKAVSEKNKDNIVGTLSDYQQLIDDRIISHHRFLKDHKKSVREKIVITIQESGDMWGYGLGMLSDLSAILLKQSINLPPLMSMAYASLSTFFIKPTVDKYYKKIKKEEDNIKAKAKETIYSGPNKKKGENETTDLTWFENEVLVSIK